MAVSGSLAMRLAGAEELLARSAAFRQRVGAASVNQAKKKISVGQVTLSDVLAMVEGGTREFARPCAIVGVHGHSYVQLAQGGQLDLGASGAVWVIFSDQSQQANDQKASMLDFCSWIGSVMDEVAQGVGKDYGASETTLWPFSQMQMFFEPFRSDLADRPAEDFWLGGYLLFDSIHGGSG